MSDVRLMLGDCLERMAEIPDGSVDLIATDLPYGVTRCRWDVIIPFESLWAHYRRILKPRGAVVLTATQPFTSMLVVSNRKWFKYCLVWEKNIVGDVMNAKNKPLREHEDIVILSPGTTANRSARRMTYNPQGLTLLGRTIRNTYSGLEASFRPRRPSHRDYRREFTNYPRSIIRIPKERGLHPTQKPVDLMEYLIRTYSHEGETVLDSCMGSGTTLIACLNTGRRGIGIEADPGYFAVAERRIAAARADCPLFDATPIPSEAR